MNKTEWVFLITDVLIAFYISIVNIDMWIAKGFTLFLCVGSMAYFITSILFTIQLKIIEKEDNYGKFEE